MRFGHSSLPIFKGVNKDGKDMGTFFRGQAESLRWWELISRNLGHVNGDQQRLRHELVIALVRVNTPLCGEYDAIHGSDTGRRS